MTQLQFGDVTVALNEHIGLVEIHRPPHNYFDADLIQNIADGFEAMDKEHECRVIVLASEGKSFCAGANFHARAAVGEEVPDTTSRLYQNAVRLFCCTKPIVATIQGAAIGGGVGLSLVADFSVVSPDARFGANFVKLGIHPGFGLTYTLPRIIGVQKANLMFYTGRRITGEEALEWGLADLLASPESLREEAMKLANEIAEGAPLAIQSTRATMRRGIVEAVKAQTDHEHAEQSRLFLTEDHKEGVKAVTERRIGNFKGR